MEFTDPCLFMVAEQQACDIDSHGSLVVVKLWADQHRRLQAPLLLWKASSGQGVHLGLVPSA